MNPSRPKMQERRRPLFRIEAEALESRQLLTGGAGNTIALTRESIAAAGGTTTAAFVVDSSHFTMPKGRMVLGVDTVGGSSSTVVPKIIGVGPHAAAPRGPHAHAKSASGGATNAVFATIKLPKKGGASHNVVTIQAQNHTQGDLLLGYYLPGDETGDGKVDQSDLSAIKAAIGKTVNDSTYDFDADANRDGKITRADLQIAMKNLGVTTTIMPDFTANLDPASDTGAADRITNTPNVKFTGQAAPGASISYAEVTGKSPGASTTADGTGTYTVSLPLSEGTNTFKVTSVDAFGQTIQGSIQPVTYTTGTVPAASA